MIPIEGFATERLVMTPITVEDAPVLVDIFSDPEVGRYIGGDELTREVLRGRFERMPAGSGRDDEAWLTWTVRRDASTVGIVQATVLPDETKLAWVIGVPWQRRGYALEATRGLISWLDARGIAVMSAHIHPANEPSISLAAKLGMRDSGLIDDDGERIYRRST